MNTVQRCTRCIMDNSSDPTITFDGKGRCNYCTEALKIGAEIYHPGTSELGAGNARLDRFVEKIKQEGKGKKYDCVMGLSGGLDSSYLAYLGHKWGLRVLAIHIDDGYDTEISKKNLENLVSATGFDYKVITPDAEQFNALTLAYLKAGVPNIAVPQDNVLFAFLYKQMKRYHIKYFLSGGNYALECILQKGNTHDAYDVVNIRAIHRRFGTKPIDKLEFISRLQRNLDTLIYDIQSPRPLNLIDYNRERAFKELSDFCGFEYYGRKHLENILTAFAQLYWFPQKFGVDKRASHLSSMIISGQMTREEALEEYSQSLYDETVMNGYIKLIRERLGISEAEFDSIMENPTHQHTDYACTKQTIVGRIVDKLARMKLKEKD